MTIHQLENGRWVAECDAPEGQEGTCGETLGDEAEGPPRIHFATLEELLGWMPGERWARTGPDGALCYVHGPYWPDGEPEPAVSPAGLEAAGQLRLPGVAS
jgi:hypothetical protein